MTDPQRRVRPEMRDAMLSFIDRAEMQWDLNEADRPHVLVAIIPEGGGSIGAILGPFDDLWEATAAAPAWQETLRRGEPEAEGLTTVFVHPLFDPKELS